MRNVFLFDMDHNVPQRHYTARSCRFGLNDVRL